MTRKILLKGLCCGLLSVSLQAHALESDRKQPIEIEADQGELDQKNQSTTFSGNVVIKQGTLNILTSPFQGVRRRLTTLPTDLPGSTSSVQDWADLGLTQPASVPADFTLYDQVLQVTATLGAAPPVSVTCWTPTAPWTSRATSRWPV
ncbi:MAG: LptA/OstA family protein, partial [Neisseria elongata]